MSTVFLLERLSEKFHRETLEILQQVPNLQQRLLAVHLLDGAGLEHYRGLAESAGMQARPLLPIPVPHLVATPQILCHSRLHIAQNSCGRIYFYVLYLATNDLCADHCEFGLHCDKS